MKCNYLCGNRVLNNAYNNNLDSTIPDGSETCDIGGWNHLSMTTFGWWDGVDATGTQNQDATVTATWIYGNSDVNAATKNDDGHNYDGA